MPSDSSFSFRCGKTPFPAASAGMLVDHLRRLAGEAPEVCLIAGGHETVRLPADEVLRVLASAPPGEAVDRFLEHANAMV